jgi:pilus assembly protein CpaF
MASGHHVRVTSAIGVIAEQVRQRVRREGVDLHGDRELAARYVRDEVQRYAELARGGSVPMLDD